jgi:hypothetical protein
MHVTRLILACLGLSLAWCSHLHAQAPTPGGVRNERLRGLAADELALLEPQLARGPVALVEFADSDHDKLPAINLALRVHASADSLLQLVKKPENYPQFMRTLDAVTLVSRANDAVVYDWSWQLSLFRLAGRNVMRIYAPPGPVTERGYRVTIDNDSGDLGTGRFLLRILPRGPNESLLLLSTRIDLRDSNYLARKVAQAARSVNRTANVALAFAMGLGFQERAEKLARYRAPVALPLPDKPLLSERAALPLLSRGDLVLMDFHGPALQQLWVYGFIPQPEAVVRRTLQDARGFGSAVIPGSKATVIEQTDKSTTFDWAIDLPLVGLSGRMRMDRDDPEILVTATGGALEGGRWRFRSTPHGRKATLVSGWAQFDLANTNWLLEQIVNSDAHLAQGLTAASEVMLMRALRSRARPEESPAQPKAP